MQESASPILFFDGVCHLCHTSVRFVLKRDPKHRYRYSSLQGETAKRLLFERHPGLRAVDSLLLWENKRIYVKSTAALKVAKQLKGGWPLLYGFILVPRFIRDGVYDFIAKNRYKWFGKYEECPVPDEKERSLFLD